MGFLKYLFDVFRFMLRPVRCLPETARSPCSAECRDCNSTLRRPLGRSVRYGVGRGAASRVPGVMITSPVDLRDTS